MSPKGKMLIFTAPSGAGKTTVVRHLLQHFGELAFSVSATNRPIRAGEEDGVAYHFLSTQDFMDRVDNGEFIEYEEVYPDRFYGTLHSEVERIWAMDRAIVFDIEVKGATNLKKFYPEESLAIFINPPNSEVLFQRLRDRNTETEADLAARIVRAEVELTYADSFDRILLNDDLPIALAEAENMVRTFLGSESEA
jgi:guanylate kinase